MATYDVDLQDNNGNSYRLHANPNTKAEFTQASTRENIKAGETHKTIFGKIMKFFADLKTVAFSGSYADLSNKPTIPSGAAANYPVANNDTTNNAEYLVTAQVAYQHGREIDQLSSDLGGLSFGKTAEGEWGYIPEGADAVIPFSSKYDLLMSDHNTSHAALSSTVPAGVTDGLFFAICAGGSSFKNLPIIDGDGILASETVYEVNQTGGSGVMLGVRILKCSFKPGGKILVKQTETATEATINASSSNLNLLFG